MESLKMLLRMAAICGAVLGLSACGDDGSTSASFEDSGNVSFDSSSSVGSADTADDVGKTDNSSSSKGSSSSQKSGSENVEKMPSSSSVEVPANWDWSVPAENRLNPEIEYDEMSDSRDDHTYKTVQIGDQVWMSQNLNYNYKAEGAAEGSICFSENEDYCAAGGRLYSWAMAKEACPQGWHLPSRQEYQALIEFADSTAEFKNQNFYYSDKVSKFLKTLSGWSTSDGENYSGKDTYGFSALPTGSCSKKENGKNKGCGFECIGEGQGSAYWTSTESDGSHAYLMSVYYEAKSGITFSSKSTFASVRCLKD